MLLLTLLIVDRVIRIRQLRSQSRAIAAQARIIVAQAARAADAITCNPLSDDQREEASDELRTYAQMLLISTPVLIGSKSPLAFLETAQRVAAQLNRALRDDGGEPSERAKTRVADAVQKLRGAAAPLLDTLSREQVEAVASDEGDVPER